MAQESDASLVKAAVNGDCGSFAVLAQRYWPAIVAIAHSILDDRHLAEDAAQETFAKAAVKLPQLRKQEHVARWLAKICRNTARDMLRAIITDRQVDDCSPRQTEPGYDSDVDAVRVCIDLLPASAKEVIYLRFYDGLSYEQISAVLGIGKQAINGRLRRAKRKLARHLQREGFGEVRL